MENEKVDLLYFSAKWCGPCKILYPLLEKLNDTRITLQKIDVDEEKDLIQEYGIRSVPSLILVDGDNIISKFDGKKDVLSIKEWIDNSLNV